MAVVLGVAPLWGSFKADWMSGRLWAPGTGNVLQNVPYDNLFPFDSNATAGMNALDAYLHANPGTVEDPTLVTTHSMGGQVAHKWMRQKGPTSGINPATIRWYMSGNPEMPHQGACFLDPVKHKPVYPGTTSHHIFCPTPAQFHGGWGVGYGPPTVCPWDITYVVGEWDGWCYWVNRNGEGALKNAAAGKLTTGSHGWYSKGDFENPRNVLWTDPDRPNLKFLVIPNDMPMLNSVKDAYTKDSETKRLRPIVLGSYDLPWDPPPFVGDPRMPAQIRKSLSLPAISPETKPSKSRGPTRKPWWQFW